MSSRSVDSASQAPNVTNTRAREPILLEIFARLSTGESVSQVMRDESAGYPTVRTFWRWIADDKAMLALYEAAIAMRVHVLGEELLDIADAREGDVMVDEDGKRIIDNEAVQRARLRVDSRKWLLSKLAPKKYGDRMELAGDKDSPVTIHITATQANL